MKDTLIPSELRTLIAVRSVKDKAFRKAASSRIR